MARGHGDGRRKSGPKRPTTKRPSASAKPAPQKKKAAPAAPPPEPPLTGTFRLGAMPGATPGRWIDTWQQRLPHAPLELVPVDVADQRAALDAETVDAALVRLPIDASGLNIIPLYDEVLVVVAPIGSHLTAAAELDVTDLVGELLIVPLDDVTHLDVAGVERPAFSAPATTADAIATVAAGVGIVIVPMSLARLHRRKDTEYVALRDTAPSSVALAWPTERQTPLVEAFIGIVRGRTANSSR